jgi:hypothetical protein
MKILVVFQQITISSENCFRKLRCSINQKWKKYIYKKNSPNLQPFLKNSHDVIRRYVSRLKSVGSGDLAVSEAVHALLERNEHKITGAETVFVIFFNQQIFIRICL